MIDVMAWHMRMQRIGINELFMFTNQFVKNHNKKFVLCNMTETKADKKEQNMDGTNREQHRTHHDGRPPKYTVGELLILAAHTLWQQISVQTVKFIRDLKLNERVDCVARFLVLHPFMALFISGFVLLFGLPFAIFSVLALTTALLTFMGIVLVEGTVITIASIIFFGFVGCILVVLLFLCGIIIAGYFGFTQFFEIFDGNSFKPNGIISNFLKKQRNGDAEPKLD